MSDEPVVSGEDGPALWLAGRQVARCAVRPEVPGRLSPRPYLHPVTTLGGTTVTELCPADHLHHLGAGVAVPDVDGFNFWGGSTFVRGQGPTDLDNHGSQRHIGFPRLEQDYFREDLSWVADGAELLRERRDVSARELTSHAWALDLTFALTNTTSRPLSVGSPATNGRPGAAYGGFFWRARKGQEPPDVFTAEGDGETGAHGSRAAWVALSGAADTGTDPRIGTDADTGVRTDRGAGWTLVFAGATERTREDPWFVRAAEYPGVGSSLAHDRRLTVGPGQTVERRVVTVVADGRFGRDDINTLVRKAVTA